MYPKIYFSPSNLWKALSDDSDSQISLVTSRIENHKDIECKEDVKEIEVPQMDPHTLMTSQRERLLVRSISFSKVKSSVPGSTVTDNYFVCPTSSRNADPC